MIQVVPYSIEYKEQWDYFIDQSKNATFLFKRDFMEYHADRFKDVSVLIFRKGKLVAIFPANKFENTVFSHQGLTYGGLVLNDSSTFLIVESVFKELLNYYRQQGFLYLELKVIPSFYCTRATEEIKYLAFKEKANNYRTDIASVVDLSNRLSYSQNKKKNLKAISSELTIGKGLKEFWVDILTPNLKERFNVDPVHTFEEIELLQSKFPENIKFFAVFEEFEMVAGTLLFVDKNVVHAQYISANERGKQFNALDFLFNLLIEQYADQKYFSFGISNENQGLDINKGLLRWKEGFGGRCFTHDFYRFTL